MKNINVKTLIMSFLLAICISSAVSALNEYNVILNTEEGISLNALTVDVKEFSDYQLNNAEDYSWEIMSGNVSLNSSYFDIEQIIFYDGVNPETGEIDRGGQKIVKLDEVVLFVPYYPSADKIIIFNQSLSEKIKVLEIDISRFTKSRDILERIDAGSQQEVVSETTSPDKYPEVKSISYVLMISIALSALLIILWYILIKRRKFFFQFRPR